MVPGDALIVEDLPYRLIGDEVFSSSTGAGRVLPAVMPDGVGQSTVGRLGLQWNRNRSWASHSWITLVSMTTQRSA